ncbi:MAG: hypothetical protein IT290_06825 [Deltaproteobacteria bacterium]|nr:hypothetical protein [Deltaproteobacteria bacterium]
MRLSLLFILSAFFLTTPSAFGDAPKNIRPVDVALATATAVNDVRVTSEGIELKHPKYHVQFLTSGVTVEPKRTDLKWRWSFASTNAPGNSPSAIPTQADATTIAYDRGAFVERYLLKAKTFEQQFVIPRMPTITDHLVISGSVRTNGTVKETPDGWQWEKNGRYVTFGKVTVIDAHGKIVPSKTKVNQDRTEIQVAAADLKTATFPVVIDPEIGTNDFRISNAGGTGDASIDANYASVALNTTNNEYLVVWSSDDTGTNDEIEIFMQRIDAATGLELGSEARISTMGVDGATTTLAFEPQVAYNSTNNEYLVVWRGSNNVQFDFDVWGQRIDGATGAEIGTDDFQISDMGPDGNAAYSAGSPNVTYNSTNNEYLVVWGSNDDSLVASDFEIFGQRIGGGTGTELGVNDFQISNMGGTIAPFNQNSTAFLPDVAYNRTNNEYLVVWHGTDTTGTLVLNEVEIYARRLDASNGNLLGSAPLRVSDMGPDGNASFDAQVPRVVWNSVNNEYLVTWQGDDNTGLLVDDEFEIFGQRLSGVTGDEIGTNDMRLTDMGTDGDGNFDVADHRTAHDPVSNRYLLIWAGDDNAATVDGEIELFGQLLNAATATEIGTNDFRISDVGTDGDGTTDVSAINGGVDAVFHPTRGEYFVTFVADEVRDGTVDSENEVYGQLLDETPPVAPTIVAPASGAVSSALTFSGTGEANGVVSLYVDGEILGTANVDGSGNWSYTATAGAIPNGRRQVTATADDAIGNTSDVTSAIDFVQSTGLGYAPLDMDADGISDVVSTKTSSAGRALTWTNSSNSAVTSITFGARSSQPAFGDYDADGTWEAAVVTKGGDGNFTWSVRNDATFATEEEAFGQNGDRLLTGCNFDQTPETELAVVRSNALIFKHFNLGTSLTVPLPTGIRAKDLRGCGDIDGDGVFEVFFYRRGPRGTHLLLAYNVVGSELLRKTVPNFQSATTADVSGDTANEIGIRLTGDAEAVRKIWFYTQSGRNPGRKITLPVNQPHRIGQCRAADTSLVDCLGSEKANRSITNLLLKSRAKQSRGSLASGFHLVREVNIAK